MTNCELKELVHLLLMCGIMDKTATESGNVTNEEWLRMKTLTEKYQTEKEQPEVKGDLISRSALKNAINEYAEKRADTLLWENDVNGIIDNAPTVEQPVGISDKLQGEWVKGKDEETGNTDLYAWTCSRCKGKYPWQPNFCPHCGAEMTQKQNCTSCEDFGKNCGNCADDEDE